jgi:hypothetical protein
MSVIANTVVVRVGRLMEICVREGFRSIEDVEQQRGLITTALATVPLTQQVVIAADWRACQLMTQAAANALGPMLGSFNTRIERSAILGTSTSPVAVLQFLRVVRDTKHPARRVFEDRRAMLTYLSNCLSPAERERLGQFLFA